MLVIVTEIEVGILKCILGPFDGKVFLSVVDMWKYDN